MGTLRAIIIGAGFAGEGHTRALRYMGVDVLALCARQPELVGAMASRLCIPIASTDWRATLEETRPDIVALGTPASLRRCASWAEASSTTLSSIRSRSWNASSAGPLFA